MDDLISRQAAIDALEEYADRLQMVDWKENPGVPYKAYALNWCINTIRDLPSAQRTGRWKGERLIYPSGIITFIYRCSECGYEERHAYEDTKPSNYCPKCGARMEV